MNALAKSIGTPACPEGLPPSLQLASLVPTTDAKAVIAEVVILLKLIDHSSDPGPLLRVFDDVVAMFNGLDPFYQACNTDYHDLHHTLDVLLATARLVHGATVDGHRLSTDAAIEALVAALFHDIGYLQERSDAQGTGAKFTMTHVERGAEIFWEYGLKKGFTEQAMAAVQSMILCTNMAIDINAIAFIDPQTELLGKILATADLLAQTADRVYLEKLLFLYREFKEAGVGGYADERELLAKTIAFFDHFGQRIRTMLDGTDRFMRPHFQARWQINASLYHEAIARNRDYLQKIIAIPGSDPLDHLKRGGIVTRFRNHLSPG